MSRPPAPSRSEKKTVAPPRASDLALWFPPTHIPLPPQKFPGFQGLGVGLGGKPLESLSPDQSPLPMGCAFRVGVRINPKEIALARGLGAASSPGSADWMLQGLRARESELEEALR